MYRAYLEENCMTVGLITAYGGSSPPAGWLLCDGASYDCDDYPELYAVVGNAYGGTPDVTFNVPDARGRALVGADTLHSLGDEFGQSEVTLGISEIPSHNHSEQGVTTEVLPYWGGGPSAASIALPTVTGNTGGGGAHENTPPSIAINYIIKA
jgi:microcystin-dependent protein